MRPWPLQRVQVHAGDVTTSVMTHRNVQTIFLFHAHRVEGNWSCFKFPSALWSTPFTVWLQTAQSFLHSNNSHQDVRLVERLDVRLNKTEGFLLNHSDSTVSFWSGWWKGTEHHPLWYRPVDIAGYTKSKITAVDWTLNHSRSRKFILIWIPKEHYITRSFSLNRGWIWHSY